MNDETILSQLAAARDRKRSSPVLFDIGRTVATPGAIDATDNPFRIKCLQRHVAGDWGGVCRQDWAMNDEAVLLGNRILSAYVIEGDNSAKARGHNTLWIITEADRSVTTFLLPGEY